jgi:peptidoglycan L-alanyl-D-glutamate endopeptidase CwlK
MKPTPRGLTKLKIIREIIAGTRFIPTQKQPPKPTPPAPVRQDQADDAGVVFDARSEHNLRSLTPEAQKKFRTWLRRVRQASIPAVVICGTRTFAEQAEIYAQGRTKPGKIVTQAKPGDSMHNYGMAIDFVVFDGVDEKGGVGQPRWESPLMTKAGQIALDMGLDWGGAWASFKDMPHIQLPRLNLADLRKQMPQGWTPS